MARLVCGRCGQYTAVNSTYCPRDKWAIFVDLPGREAISGPNFDFELPQGSGFLARKRHEAHRDHLERTYRENLERRNDALEKRLEDDPENPDVLKALGLIAYLEDQFERANALLERAFKIAPDDFELNINYAISLARRGQLQPALNVLGDARQKFPKNPLVLLNLAQVALKAHRAALVHEVIDELERLWLDNPNIARDYHDPGVTARGLAFLLENRSREALTQLTAAARHAVNLKRNEARVEEIGDGMTVTRDAISEEAGELVLEGKTTEAEALNNLALAEAGLGDLENAQARLRAALRLEPGHPQVLNNLGVLAYRQGNLNAAFRYLDAARQIADFSEKSDPLTWNHLGVVQSAMGQLQEGLNNFQRAGGSDHAEFEVYYNLGRAFIEHGQADAGVGFLRQAFAIDPNNADVHTVLGAAYLFSGKVNFYSEALKHLKRAIQIDSHHRTAAANLIFTLVEIRNLDAAKGILQQALKLFPAEAEPFYMAALITLDEAKLGPEREESFWADGAQKFDTALSRRPDITAALYNSALCQFMMGFRDTSAKLLDASVQRDPSLGAAYYLIGFGHAVGKRDNEALAAWKIAATYENDNPDLHANMGSLYYRRGEYQHAVRCYANAHRLLPNDAGILSAMGVAFAQQKMFQQAISALEQAITINPRSPVAHSNLGLAYYMFKRVEQAIDHWRIVSQLDSSYAARREQEQLDGRFDESVIQLRPIQWRDRVVKIAPVLPRPRTRLLPASGTDPYQLAVADPSLMQILNAKREVEYATRTLAWMSLKN